MLQRRHVIFALALTCASCGEARQDNETQTSASVLNDLPEAPAVDATMTGEADQPGGRAPVSGDAIDPRSADGARQVLQLFGELLEDREFGDAYGLWSDGGRASGLTEAQFIAMYAKYGDIHSEVGAPGRMEGAAGSTYVEIPYRLHGRLKGGGPFNLVGSVTLRRVNDIPGSTEDQRRWHIYKSDLAARP